MKYSYFIADPIFVLLSGLRAGFDVPQILKIQNTEYFKVGVNYGWWLDP